MEMTKEYTSFSFDSRDMLLFLKIVQSSRESFFGFKLSCETISKVFEACYGIKRLSFYLELTLDVFLALISILYFVQVLSRLLTIELLDSDIPQLRHLCHRQSAD